MPTGKEAIEKKAQAQKKGGRYNSQVGTNSFVASLASVIKNVGSVWKKPKESSRREKDKEEETNCNQAVK